MVSTRELFARIGSQFRFDRQELSGLVVAIIATGFIFSFRDWGEDSFNFALGLTNFFIATLVVAFSFLFRISIQKVHCLNHGYLGRFKTWWGGVVIALILAFISVGRIPLIIAGGLVTTFVTRQRLGEFRYGHSYQQIGAAALWGPMANMILAVLFSIGLYFFPENYGYTIGLWVNLIMAFCSMIPIPQLDGLAIFFGSRGKYYTGIIAILLGGILLLTKTQFGLIAAVVIVGISVIVYLAMWSEK